jgi:ATP-dependent DNA helicase RecG
MSLKISKITDYEKSKLLELNENHFCDFKSKDIKATKITKHLSAFANADGGEMYLGIEERDNKFYWDGFTSPEAANAHIQVLEDYFPLGGDCEYEFLVDNKGSYVLKIDIHKSNEIKTSSEGKVYLRRGAQSLPQSTDDQLDRLKRNKGIVSFENELVNVPIEFITSSEVTEEFIKSIVPYSKASQWIKKQLLIRDSKPTVVGVLLFADEPQAALPKRCGIKIYRYKTKNEATRDSLDFNPITIEGCLYNQIYTSVDTTIKIIESIKIISNNELEEVNYPREAIHEIITNAVIHRDYYITDDIHIRIFDNRVEVENPGTLPAHINVKNILEERFSRNGAIVRLINKFPNPPNKDIGEGLNTAFQSMRRLKLKDPEIIQKDNSVLVKIKHEPLASPEEIILNYLKENDRINNSKGREICFIGSENVMKRILQGMIKTGLIESIPGKKGRATAYRLVLKD